MTSYDPVFFSASPRRRTVKERKAGAKWCVGKRAQWLGLASQLPFPGVCTWTCLSRKHFAMYVRIYTLYYVCQTSSFSHKDHEACLLTREFVKGIKASSTVEIAARDPNDLSMCRAVSSCVCRNQSMQQESSSQSCSNALWCYWSSNIDHYIYTDAFSQFVAYLRCSWFSMVFLSKAANPC